MNKMMSRAVGRALLIALACPAIAAGSSETQRDTRGMDTMTASTETTEQTGVATWATFTDSSGRHVLGLDADGDTVAELEVTPRGQDVLDFAVQGEALTLWRDGTISGAASAPAVSLVRALHADTSARGYRETFDAGWFCAGGQPRWYFDSYMLSGAASCYVERWRTDDAHDCSVSLHIGVSVFGVGTCRVMAYTN